MNFHQASHFSVDFQSGYHKSSYSSWRRNAHPHILLQIAHYSTSEACASVSTSTQRDLKNLEIILIEFAATLAAALIETKLERLELCKPK